MSQEILPSTFDFRCCLLCYSNSSYFFNEIPNFIPHIPQIIFSCRKYLSKDIVDSLNINCSSDTVKFCLQCSENISQLSKLDIQLEQTKKDINQLVFQLSERITKERGNYNELKTSEAAPFLENDSFLTFTSEEPNQNWDSTEDTVLLNANTNSSLPAISTSTTVEPGNSFDVEVCLEQGENFESGPEIENSQEKEKNSNTSDKEIPVVIQTKVIKTTVTSSDLQLQQGNSGFACQNCQKKFTRLDILQRHQCGAKTYECDICGKSFSSQGSLKLHNRSHTGEKPHKCEICGKGFGLPHHLRLHIRMHTGERPYECEFCKKSFKDIGYLAKHKLQHSNDESERRKYSCEVCRKSFTLYSTLKKHLVSQHTGDTPHKCLICGKAFGSSTDLRHHNVVHTKEKAFKCKQCGKSYSRRDTLKEHMLCHEGHKKYQCEKCGKSYYNKSALINHNTLKHSDEGVFICDICGNSYKNHLVLKIHRRCHIRNSENHEKYKCLVCDRMYTKSYDLLRHQKESHYVTTVENVTCEKCAMEFQDYPAYDRHGRRKLSRYKCNICVESFTSRCEMACHFNEKHSKLELPYKCKNCSTRFISMTELIQHKLQDCISDKPDTLPKPKLKRQSRPSASKKTSRPKKANSGKTGRTKVPKKQEKNVISRTSRPRNAKINKNIILESDSENNDEVDELPQDESHSENEDTIEENIKTEPEDWIKQEADDFSE